MGWKEVLFTAHSAPIIHHIHHLPDKQAKKKKRQQASIENRWSLLLRFYVTDPRQFQELRSYAIELLVVDFGVGTISFWFSGSGSIMSDLKKLDILWVLFVFFWDFEEDKNEMLRVKTMVNSPRGIPNMKHNNRFLLGSFFLEVRFFKKVFHPK